MPPKSHLFTSLKVRQNLISVFIIYHSKQAHIRSHEGDIWASFTSSNPGPILLTGTTYNLIMDK